jgi:hypothetical protein
MRHNFVVINTLKIFAPVLNNNNLQTSPSSCSYFIQFYFLSSILGIAFLFHLPVPRHRIGSVLVSSSARDCISTCSLCCRFSGLAVVQLQICQWPPSRQMHIFSLSEYSHIVHRPVSLSITQLVFLCQNYCVCSIYIFEMTVPLKSTVISNPYVQLGCNIWFMNQ